MRRSLLLTFLPLFVLSAACSDDGDGAFDTVATSTSTGTGTSTDTDSVPPDMPSDESGTDSADTSTTDPATTTGDGDGDATGDGDGDATGDGDGDDPTTTGDGGCGNNVVDIGEQCDGEDLNGFTCTDLGYDGGDLACDPVTCTYDASLCTTDGGTGGSGGTSG